MFTDAGRSTSLWTMLCCKTKNNTIDNHHSVVYASEKEKKKTCAVKKNIYKNLVESTNSILLTLIYAFISSELNFRFTEIQLLVHAVQLFFVCNEEWTL